MSCCSSGKIVWWMIFILSAFFISFFVLRFFVKARKKNQRRKKLENSAAEDSVYAKDSARKNLSATAENSFTIAFFHPYCNAGGGGERVLWCAVKYLQEKYNDVDIYVYTGDVDAKPEEILTRIRTRFGVSFLRPVEFVYLKRIRLVEASLYPYFTLLGQSLGEFLLGLEALFAFVPDVFVDSMGYPFAAPLFRYLASCRIASYVHYPTISCDMLRLVAERRQNFNNRPFIVNSRIFSCGKLIYYRLFAKLYGLVGRSSHVIMVNSSWTYDHIVQLWRRPQRTVIVYPPCDVDQLKTLINESERLLVEREEVRILSIGQFRPEKNHAMQLHVLRQLNETVQSLDNGNNCPIKNDVRVKLILIGGCRDVGDERRVNDLKELAENLGIEKQVEWKLNISFEELKREYARALIGLHTMLNEHFGIGVVECMAAGLIMLAHDSGGPKMDIIGSQSDNDSDVGFLASTVDQYVRKIVDILSMTPREREHVRRRAKASCERFSDENFQRSFIEAFDNLLYDASKT